MNRVAGIVFALCFMLLYLFLLFGSPFPYGRMLGPFYHFESGCKHTFEIDEIQEKFSLTFKFLVALSWVGYSSGDLLGFF